jgi:hypothetical protein
MYAGTVKTSLKVLMSILLAHSQMSLAGEEAEGIANTAISVAVIGLTTFLVLRSQAAEAALREQAAADALQKAQVGV